MRSFKYIALALVVLLTTACAAKVGPKEIIIYKPKEVYIPMPCDVEVRCDFSGESFEPTINLLRCVEEQKRALDYCRQIPMEENYDHD